MKYPNLILSILVMIFINASGYAQNSMEAARYMSEITKPIEEMKGETWQYLKAVTRGRGARKVEAKRQKLIKEISNAKSQTSAVKPYSGDGSLRQASLDYLGMLNTVLKEDYDKILDMEAIAEQSYDLMEAYLTAQEKAGEKLDEAGDKFNAAQKSFADKFEVNLLESEGDKKDQKIKKASDALAYYNRIYLIFFKSYKQEAYVLAAMNNGDINGMEQNAGSLVSVSEEGLEKLKAINAFKGDVKLREMAKRMMVFYKKEGESYFPSQVDFYVKKDNFEKVQKMIESKGKKKTQQDVDQFNKAAKEYNEAVNKYNQTNDKGNSERTQLFNEWNKKVEEFFDSHA